MVFVYQQHLKKKVLLSGSLRTNTAKNLLTRHNITYIKYEARDFVYILLYSIVYHKYITMWYLIFLKSLCNIIPQTFRFNKNSLKTTLYYSKRCMSIIT